MIKNKKYLIITIILLLILNVFLIFKKNTSVIEKSKINKIERKEFNIYLQQTVGSEDYNPSNNTTFPSQGYLLNTTKTMCYDYNGKETSYKPTQNFVNEIIDGSITIESNKTTYCNLYFDKNETPSISNFEIKGKTSNNQELNNGFTYDKGIYTITWNDADVVQYCLTTDSKTCTDWQLLEETNRSSKTITTENNTFTNEEGLKTIYAFIKDRANNISASSSKSITADQTAPAVTSFLITGSSENPFTVTSSYSHTKSVTYSIKWSASDVEEYCISNNNKTCSNWVTSSGTNVSATSPNIEDTEGNKTMYAYIKDKAGNISTTIEASTQKIYLDKSNPTAKVEEDSHDAKSITVIVSGEDANGILKKECQATNGSEIKKEEADDNGSCTIGGLTDGTTYIVIGIVTDNSGRVTNSDSISVTTDKKGTTGSDLLNNPPKGLLTELFGDMYRFNGGCNAKDNNGTGCDGIVDNFVCFGYNDSKTDCVKNTDGVVNLDNDYIYRIIGITIDGQMKLIKNTSIKENGVNGFIWYGSNQNERYWNNSEIFKRLNGISNGITSGSSGNTNLFIDSSTTGINYLKSKGSEEDMKWYSKIENHVWKYGRLYREQSEFKPNEWTADKVYGIESSFGSEVTAKIGLMYVSDFYYSYSYNVPSTTICDKVYYRCSPSWLVMTNNGAYGYYEWLMTIGPLVPPRTVYGESEYSGLIFTTPSGSITTSANNTEWLIRPVFYLNRSILIESGTGTSTDPFIIAK